MRANESLLDLFLELQNLDRVARSGWALRGVAQGESVTEHSWHVLFLVWALGPADAGARRRAGGGDRGGPRPRRGAAGRPAANRLALSSGGGEEGGRAGGDRRAAGAAAGRGRWSCTPSTRRGRPPEARLVKACDKLQLMIKATAYERWGAAGLGEFWDNPDNFPDGGLAPVAELFAELRRRRAGMSLTLADLPALNATLNATAGVLLLAGYLFIRQRPLARPPRLHGGGALRLGGLLHLVPHLPRPRRLDAVPGRRADPRRLLHDPDQPHPAGGDRARSSPPSPSSAPPAAASTATSGSPAGRCRSGSTSR